MNRFSSVALLLCWFASSPAYVAARPNFLIVLADDCTYHDIGCYGGQSHTPNIDRLATEGMRLTHCFQCAPMCSPTRHNIYTGQYPVKTGAYPNHTFAYDHVTSIGHHLKPLGYRVALSGKRHIGPEKVFDFEYSGRKNPDMVAIDKMFGECASSKTPFCLFACSNEPHTPWNKGNPSRYPASQIKLPPYLPDTPEMRDGFRRYLAEISYFDGQVGQLLNLLDKHALTNDTMVMVLSEQGNSLPFAKWTCYDNGLRSAMVVRWPSKVRPGSVSHAMVEYVDITPTLVDLAGGNLVKQFDGRSISGVLSGAASEHKEFVFGLMTTRGIKAGNDSYPIRSVRSRTHKLILNLQHNQTFTNACVTSPEFQSLKRAAEAGNADAKLAIDRYQNRPAVELYDTANDPNEMHNLANRPELASIVSLLRKELDAWMKSQGDGGIETEMRAHERQKRRRRN